MVPVDFVVVRGLAHDHLDRRIEAHRFLEHHSGVVKFMDGLDRGHASVQDRTLLLPKPSRHLPVLVQKVPGPRERVHRRLVSGDEERDEFVAELPPVHALARFLIAGAHQYRKQVLPSRLATPLLDSLVDVPVDGVQTMPESAVCRRGEEHGKRDQVGGTPVDESHAVLKRLVDPRCLVVQIPAEKDANDNIPREARHLLVDLDRTIATREGFPPRKHIANRVHHHIHKAHRAPGREERLHDPVLAFPEVSLARYQTLSQQQLLVVVPVTFEISAPPVHQHVFNVLRAGDQVHRLAPDVHPDHVAVRGPGIPQKPDRVLPKRQDAAQKREPGRSGGARGGSGWIRHDLLYHRTYCSCAAPHSDQPLGSACGNHLGIAEVRIRGSAAVISTLSSMRTPPTVRQDSSVSQSTIPAKRSRRSGSSSNAGTK